MKNGTLILFSFFTFLVYAQKDTLHIHYFPSNELSSIIVLEDNREGFAKAYNLTGKEIYSANIRRYAGHESVEFKHHGNGMVSQANYSSAPDGGIQWYKSTTSFDENGVVTNVQEYSHENLLSPIHVVPKPIVQEVVECAVIHENIIVLHNHCRFSVEYVFSTNDEPKSVVIQSGEIVEVFTYISAQITQKPSGVYEIQALSKKKRSKNKLHSMMEVKKKGNSKTEYHFHVFESSIRE